MFKNILFIEHFQTTVSKYPVNMPRTFKTKCEKNDSNDILITYLHLHFNPFAGKGVKNDPRQQNDDFERSGVSSRLKFYTGSLELASDRISHKIFGLDHQNSRNSNFNLIFCYFHEKFGNFLSFFQFTIRVELNEVWTLCFLLFRGRRM